ncbi:SET-domain-containing protein [Mycena kentingensis (nom. inval.)]|nr:SET-domain-containing protein [Mycena kentingensis (nom. inval.)]
MSAHDPTFVDSECDVLGTKAEDKDDQNDADSHALRNHTELCTVAAQLRRDVERDFRHWKAKSILKPAMDLWRCAFPLIPPSPLSVVTESYLQTVPEEPREDAVVHYDIGTVQPAYTDIACRRRRTSLAHNDDNLAAPFMPFPDDDSFPRDEYMSHFKGGAAWVQYNKNGPVRRSYDPDDEYITYMTLRRLNKLGWTAEQLDYVLTTVPGMGGVPPYASIEAGRSYESGCLWAIRQRDILLWSDPEGEDFPPDFAIARPGPHDFFSQVIANNRKFCANLNCLTTACNSHIPHDSPLIPVAPKLTSNELVYQKLKETGTNAQPCSNECFLNSCFDDQDMDVECPEDLITAPIRAMLLWDPDASPCDLAFISQTQCRMAYKLRCAIINDALVVASKEASPESIALSQKPKHEIKAYTQPCYHPGQCGLHCSCAQDDVHCERNCCCELTCPRRWKGCNRTCAQRKKCDPTARHKEQCVCKAADRECDAELCTGCNARSQDPPPLKRRSGVNRKPIKAAAYCNNMALQRGVEKLVVIKQCEYGLGAFAGQRFKAEELVGEYFGELFDNDAEVMGHKAVVHQYLSNYCYELGEMTVDARQLGNPMRFLNDSMPHEPNCAAYPKVINGQRRIGIYALCNIKRGQEMTLSYGEEYWGENIVDRD